MLPLWYEMKREIITCGLHGVTVTTPSVWATTQCRGKRPGIWSPPPPTSLPTSVTLICSDHPGVPALHIRLCEVQKPGLARLARHVFLLSFPRAVAVVRPSLNVEGHSSTTATNFFNAFILKNKGKWKRTWLDGSSVLKVDTHLPPRRRRRRQASSGWSGPGKSWELQMKHS